MAGGLLNRVFPKSFPKSLWVFHTNAGGCNGCDIEVLDALTPYFDVERLGMRLVGSPRRPRLGPARSSAAAVRAAHARRRAR